MRVRFTRTHRVGGQTFQPGSVGDLNEQQAQQAIAAGAAEELDPMANVATNDEGEPVMQLRFRHNHTVGDTAYFAGQQAAVPVSDEAWAAVNEGHADLIPPPGEAGQPFPPEELTEAEVPLPAGVQPTAVQAQPAETARITARQPAQPAARDQEQAQSKEQTQAQQQAATEQARRIQTAEEAKRAAAEEAGQREAQRTTEAGQAPPPPRPGGKAGNK